MSSLFDDGHDAADPLPAPLRRRLEGASPVVRKMIEKLTSQHSVERMAGLDAISEHVVRQDSITAAGPEAVPYLLALAAAPRHPLASAVLVRLSSVLAATDDPPRSMALDEERRRSQPLAAATWDAFRAALPALVRIARDSRDPEACRNAACMAARFPEVDDRVEPILIALIPGASDAHERARLLYALARVQASRHVPLHPRVFRALAQSGVTVEKAAVALALGQSAGIHHELDDVTGRRVRLALEALVDADAAAHWSDPRAWGRRLAPHLARDLLR